MILDFGKNLFDGNFYYTSLVEKLNLNIEDDEEFWDILILDNWIIFQSLHRFIFLDKTTNEVKYLKINGTIQFSIVLDIKYISVQNQDSSN